MRTGTTLPEKDITKEVDRKSNHSGWKAKERQAETVHNHHNVQGRVPTFYMASER